MRKRKSLGDLIVEASEMLDPQHQGQHWPDPIAWDGRPLDLQAMDLVPLLEGEAKADRLEPDVRMQELADALLRGARSARIRRLRRKGYRVTRGAYVGTTDDRIDRWYILLPGPDAHRWGAGYSTRAEAWDAALKVMGW